jgi:hypothetical protein
VAQRNKTNGKGKKRILIFCTFVQLHYILIKRNIYRFKVATVVSQTPEENTNLNLFEVNIVGGKAIKI